MPKESYSGEPFSSPSLNGTGALICGMQAYFVSCESLPASPDVCSCLQRLIIVEHRALSVNWSAVSLRAFRFAERMQKMFFFLVALPRRLVTHESKPCVSPGAPPA